MDEDNPSKKAHRKRQAGGKVDKKKKKSPIEEGLSAKQRNPKAFAFQSVNKVARQVRRTLDVQEKKHHIPVVDRQVAEPPPVLVAVVGPPKVGKSTLVQCLVKNFARQKVSDIKGPVTVVSAKKKRITFMECNNDVNCMIDVAKTADLVLLMIDASFDYEMETLEFINICQVHGFPKIIGVLTHLDLFRDTKKLRKKKKTLKDRFWKEVYQGAKLFYLSGMINGEYQKTEVHNLGRFISVMKFRPLQWRSTHPYILADRMEDVTHPETLRKFPKSDRSVCLYGYIRGCHYRNHTHVHLPGCGDFMVHDMSLLEDPCPLPDQIKKRSLNEKERLIWAPMSGVGGFTYDKDGIHIDASHLKDKKSDATRPLTQMVDAMIGSKKTIDEKLADAQFKMFTDSALDSVNGVQKNNNGDDAKESMEDEDEDNDDDDASDNENENSDIDDDIKEPDKKRLRTAKSDGSDDSVASDSDDDDVDGSDDDDDDEDDDEDDEDGSTDDDNEMDVDGSGSENSDTDEDGNVRWKADLAKKASEAFFRRMQSKPNLTKLVYGDQNAEIIHVKKEEDKDMSIGGVFRAVETSANDADGINGVDCCLSCGSAQFLEWDDETIIASIKDCFVTGKWDDGEDANKRLADDDDLTGGFVDLETGEVHGQQDDSNEDSDDSEGSKSASDNEDQEEQTKETAVERRQRRMKEKLERSKLRKKAMFDMEYDDKGDGEKKTYFEEWKSEMDVQAKLNRGEFDGLSEEARVQYEGFRPGLYVRVQINDVPAEFVDNFDATYPIVLGGLLPAEQSVGYVTIRLKQHRWFGRKLKTKDPLIVSLGWRRFQTVILYSMQDHNGRHRYLKYTPDHLHCHATFWGPITPQGTGMLGIQTVSSSTPRFRIAVTGAVAELDKAFTIVKKLKLEGTPYKIYKNTAFIQGMFNSSLEVAKFEGSMIQTVSKIRGQVKKAVREGAAGSFRATFEDKIQLSDIVFLKTWIPVQIPQFYNPVTSLLLPVGAKDSWQGMKTVGELKREKGIRNDVKTDHLYKPIERRPRVFAPLVIPRELQKALPFAVKPKVPKPVKDTVQSQRVAIVREPKERQVAQMMKRLKVMYEAKRKQERATMRQRAELHQKQMSRIEAGRAVKRKERAKHAYFLLGQSEKHGKEQN